MPVAREISGHVPRAFLSDSRTYSSREPLNMDAKLAEYRYARKRSAAISDLRQGSAMPRPRTRPAPPKEPKTPLHALFQRRVKEELAARGLSVNALKAYGAPQRTVADALQPGGDPRLSTIYRIARALGIENAYVLLKESETVARQGKNVTTFPPHPPIVPPTHSMPAKKVRDGKKAHE